MEVETRFPTYVAQEYYIARIFDDVAKYLAMLVCFLPIFEEKVGIDLPLMEEVNAESELSSSFEL